MTYDKSRDHSVFSDSINQHANKAYSFAYRLAGNEQDARDLVQEAFARALKYFEKYDPARPFGPWVNRILKNVFEIDNTQLCSFSKTREQTF